MHAQAVETMPFLLPLLGLGTMLVNVSGHNLQFGSDLGTTLLHIYFLPSGTMVTGRSIVAMANNREEEEEEEEEGEKVGVVEEGTARGKPMLQLMQTSSLTSVGRGEWVDWWN